MTKTKHAPELCLSRFNTFARLEEQRAFVVYNGVSGQILELSENVYEHLRGNRLNLIDSDWRERLCAGGVLTPLPMQQLIAIRRRYEEKRNSSQMRTIIVSPTMACNLQCPYCYERHLPNRRGGMTGETEERVARFIENQLEQADCQTVVLKFYGGEPLLAADTCVRLADRARRAAQLADKRLIVWLQTNGTLLDQQLLDDGFKTLNCVELTIDGPRALHDRVRVNAAGDPTFERIAETARMTAERGIPASLRINADTVEDMLAALEDLDTAGVFDSGAASFYYGQVRHDFLEDVMGIACPAHIESPEMLRQALAIRRSVLASPFAKYFQNFPLFNRSSPICDFEKGTCFSIDPAGDLYACIYQQGNEQFRTGSLRPDGSVEFTELHRRLIGRTPFSSEECSTCSALSQCWGGCFLRAQINANDPCAHHCGYQKELVSRRLNWHLQELRS